MSVASVPWRAGPAWAIPAKAGELCAKLGVSLRTFYCPVNPKGTLLPNGEKLFGRSTRRSCLILNLEEAGT